MPHCERQGCTDGMEGLVWQTSVTVSEPRAFAA
jgi:hypothetical protein